MSRFSRNRSATGMAVLLALALIALCVFASASDKYNFDFDFEFPGNAFESINPLHELLRGLDLSGDGDNSTEMQNALPAMENSGSLEVHFIDVGQGKSILIKAGGKTVLIDAGENSEGNAVVGYLRDHGVQSIDYAIGTHPHSDHIGGMDAVINSLPVENIILPEIPEAIIPTTRTYTDLLMAIATNGVNVITAEAGQTFTLDSAVLTVLGPVGEYGDLNNESVVTRLVYGKISFLFTGDIEEAAEADILASGATVRSDVLDVAHHGSQTSSSDDFIEAVSPKIAVVSCGIDNTYGHPNKQAMQRVMSVCKDIYRTDLDGSVVIVSDGSDLNVFTVK